MNLRALDDQGKTNSRRFLELCQRYREKSQQYSSNSGDIKSMFDITNNLRRTIQEDERKRAQDATTLLNAVQD